MTRSATLIRTGLRVERCASRLTELYDIARGLHPQGFPGEETITLDSVLDHVSVGYVDALATEVAEKLALPREWLQRDRFWMYACGPISLHDDAYRYRSVCFVIVIAHSGGLGVVDRRGRAVRHETGEILLLDPCRKHALLPEGLTADEYPYERTHSLVADPARQFMFLDFDVPRRRLRDRFAAASPKTR